MRHRVKWVAARDDVVIMMVAAVVATVVYLQSHLRSQPQESGPSQPSPHAQLPSVHLQGAEQVLHLQSSLHSQPSAHSHGSFLQTSVHPAPCFEVSVDDMLN